MAQPEVSPVEPRSAYPDDLVYSLAYSPNGAVLASGRRDLAADRGLQLWDAATLKPIAELPAGRFVFAVAFSPDNRHVVSSSKNILSGVELGLPIWDAQSGKLADPLSAESNPRRDVKYVAFSASGKWLAASHSGHAEIWDFTAKTLLRSIEPGSESAVAFSPDESLLATAEGNNRVKLWEVATGKQVGEVHAMLGILLSVDFSHDGKLNSASGQLATKVWDVSQSGETYSLTERDVIPGGLSVDFSLDDKLVATGSHNGLVYLYNLESHALAKKILVSEAKKAIQAVCFSPDGKELACGGLNRGGPETIGLVTVFNVAATVAQ